MKAFFAMRGPEEVVVVLEPDPGVEAMLCAMWMRYDSNTFSVIVDRSEDAVKSITILASPSS
jgi:hypothetical protein